MSTILNPKSNCYSITHETVNFSTAKQKYSFAKSKRFSSIDYRTPGEFTQDLGTTFGKRSPSFGCGDRFKNSVPIFKSDMPSPNQYKLKSVFDGENPAIRTTTHAFSFGPSASREAYQKVYNPGQKSPLRSIDIPGPGQYIYQNMAVGWSSRKYSMRPRTRNHLEPEELMKKQRVPGPGTYCPAIGINKLGKYAPSTMPNSRASIWSPSRRFRDDDAGRTSQIPGPGQYNPSDIDSQGGNMYIVSNFRNAGVTKIAPESRAETAQGFSKSPTNAHGKETPGPGQYQLPSEFGTLEPLRGGNMRGGTAGNMNRGMPNRLQMSHMNPHTLQGISDFDTDRSPQNRSLFNPPGHGVKYSQAPTNEDTLQQSTQLDVSGRGDRLKGDSLFQQ